MMDKEKITFLYIRDSDELFNDPTFGKYFEWSTAHGCNHLRFSDEINVDGNYQDWINAMYKIEVERMANIKKKIEMWKGMRT